MSKMTAAYTQQTSSNLCKPNNIGKSRFLEGNTTEPQTVPIDH